MKHRGNVSEELMDRDRDLMAAYRSYASATGVYDVSTATAYLQTAPAPRFYVSAERLVKVMGLMERGADPLRRMHHERRRMYEALWDLWRVRERGASLREEAEGLLERATAPSFYLTRRTIRNVLYKGLHRRGQYVFPR